MSFVPFPFISEADLGNLSLQDLKALHARVAHELAYAEQRVADLAETTKRIEAAIENLDKRSAD